MSYLLTIRRLKIGYIMLELIFMIPLLILIVCMVCDDDNTSYGHHDSRPDSFYQISHRKDKDY